MLNRTPVNNFIDDIEARRANLEALGRVVENGPITEPTSSRIGEIVSSVVDAHRTSLEIYTTPGRLTEIAKYTGNRALELVGLRLETSGIALEREPQATAEDVRA